jgi:hypothetical protein
MVSTPLFEHVKNTLKVYKENRISIHFDKLEIADCMFSSLFICFRYIYFFSFFLSSFSSSLFAARLLFLEPHYMFNSKFVKPVSLVPFEGLFPPLLSISLYPSSFTPPTLLSPSLSHIFGRPFSERYTEHVAALS